MKLRKLTRRDRPEWIVDYYLDGKRVRKWFKSRMAAKAEVAGLREQQRTGGQVFFEMTPEERAEVALILSEARGEGVTLRALWEGYKSGRLDGAPRQRRTLRQAIEETIAAKRAENLRERYVAELENYLRRFARGREQTFVDRLGVAEIEAWFDKRQEALSTRKSNLGRLGSMFDLCWRRGYIKENPAARITPPTVEGKAPVILTPEQAKALLRACSKSHRALLPWLALGLFAGVRPEEITRLHWGDVDTKAGTVRIDAAASKVRRRRIVPLHQTALDWLKRCKRGAADAPITPPLTTLRRGRRALAKRAGIEWSQDLLRHCAGTYLLGLHGDSGKVSGWLGNSPRILESHYKGLVTAAAVKAFWALTPTAVSKSAAPKSGRSRPRRAPAAPDASEVLEGTGKPA